LLPIQPLPGCSAADQGLDKNLPLHKSGYAGNRLVEVMRVPQGPVMARHYFAKEKYWIF
tara:strand:+ start:1220 stop:1396 length:177 start_codon:yes stop_codon:yes gene_type:complete